MDDTAQSAGPSAASPSTGAPRPPAPELLLDVKGLSCPLPVLRANRMLRGMPEGSRLRVLATDRAAVQDFHAFCRETGHALVAFGEEAGVLSFTIRRRSDPPA
ncbi:sulfurtransferase TusA family protein [Lichenicola cladoniae]|uniref:Sulfurtransferase TusA family protein n=1 Tax=Lichenicola cladoniae TaxID=1484109 RepID=A0A6M8HSW8_9PROT|nr:sulfurtransferase TusA family protein [Acetobacteraceae bacterium]QKE91604.1 sulfurtransferase TusA family protein [Lichenicola cladoniae]